LLITFVIVGAIVGARLGWLQRPRRGVVAAIVCLVWIAVSEVLFRAFPRSALGLELIVPFLNVLLFAFLIGSIFGYFLGMMIKKVR
jgi:hypothetical protein